MANGKSVTISFVDPGRRARSHRTASRGHANTETTGGRYDRRNDNSVQRKSEGSESEPDATTTRGSDFLTMVPSVFGSPLGVLMILLEVGLPLYGLYLIYRLLQELRALRNSVDELRNALESERKN